MASTSLRTAWRDFRSFPYDSLPGAFSFSGYILLKLAPKRSFPKMSIIPMVRRHYRLSSDGEFWSRYHASQALFEELWRARDRSDRESMEHFYLEHDSDLWC